MVGNMARLRTIQFSEFHLWDVKRFVKSGFASQYEIVALGKHISERSEKAKLYEYVDETFGILGVNNKEGVFDAYTEAGKNINQAYKTVKDFDLTYNPYRVNVGSIGMKTAAHHNQYISPAYVVFECKPALEAEFLYRLFKTDAFNQIINDNTTGSVRQNLKFETLAKIKIPLPPMPEQNRMVTAYNAKIALAERQEAQAKALEQGIDDYLFKILSIDRKINAVKNSRLQFVNAAKITVWGADRLLQGGNNSILHSSIFQNKKLSEVAYINPRTDLTNLANADEMSFIPMECVSDEYGDVMELRQGKKADSKGYTKFQEDDLIWARITPCMQNGKSAIVKNLANKLGYGSTEYHVVRIKNQDCSLEFLHILLRTNTILQDATHYFTGSAGQQRVPKSYLENLEIPIPPLEIQQKIALYIANLKTQIKTLKSQAERNRAEAIQAFELAIFNH